MFYIPIIGSVLAVVFGVNSYNKLIKLRNKVEEGWSGINVQLNRRYSLIPNLVETVKGITKHESKFFQQLAGATAKALEVNQDDIAQRSQAERQISNSLHSVIAIAEDYPDLRSNENFLHLQGELSDIEDHIQKSRRYYNALTRDYNTYRDQFPAVAIANMFHFPHYEFFQAKEEATKNVNVKF